MDNIFYFLKCVISMMLLPLCSFAQSDVINLDNSNIDATLESNELVLVNFYADWCHFSQMLTPIFAETATKLKETFPAERKVALAKVDCDKEVTIAQKYHVSKYPTLKVFRHGEVLKREFRGQRSVEGMLEFLKDQLNDRIQIVTDAKDIKFEDNKRYVVGHFFKKESPSYKTFNKLATQFRDDCTFVIMDKNEKPEETIYAQTGGKEEKIAYDGKKSDYEALVSWTRERCVPLVRTITFMNAEELTEEGLPFLLLFTKKDDVETPKLYEEAVKRELMDLRTSVNVLMGDGEQFSHPLHHLGKSTNDLPILCIDSFRHMFVYPQDAKTGLTTPGQLRKFVEDLQSGKLHREFHNGPDPVPETAAPSEEKPAAADAKGEEPSGGAKHEQGHVPRDGSEQPPPARKDVTTPPESMFRLLQPSSNRYTLLRDEL